MKTSSLAKSLPKYLAVAFSALILGSVALITSALIHADAKASTSPSEPTSETNLHEDDPEETEDITDETDSDSDDSSATLEQSGVAQDQVASSNSTPQVNTSTNTTSSTNPQSNADSSAPQSNSGAQDQVSASDNKEQQVAQADDVVSEPVTAETSTSEEEQNGQGTGIRDDGIDDGKNQEKSLLDLSDYYRQG